MEGIRPVSHSSGSINRNSSETVSQRRHDSTFCDSDLSLPDKLALADWMDEHWLTLRSEDQDADRESYCDQCIVGHDRNGRCKNCNTPGNLSCLQHFGALLAPKIFECQLPAYTLSQVSGYEKADYKYDTSKILYKDVLRWQDQDNFSLLDSLTGTGLQIREKGWRYELLDGVLLLMGAKIGFLPIGTRLTKLPWFLRSDRMVNKGRQALSGLAVHSLFTDSADSKEITVWAWLDRIVNDFSAAEPIFLSPGLLGIFLADISSLRDLRFVKPDAALVRVLPLEARVSALILRDIIYPFINALTEHKESSASSAVMETATNLSQGRVPVVFRSRGKSRRVRGRKAVDLKVANLTRHKRTLPIFDGVVAEAQFIGELDVPLAGVTGAKGGQMTQQPTGASIDEYRQSLETNRWGSRPGTLPGRSVPTRGEFTAIRDAYLAERSRVEKPQTRATNLSTATTGQDLREFLGSNDQSNPRLTGPTQPLYEQPRISGPGGQPTYEQPRITDSFGQPTYDNPRIIGPDGQPVYNQPTVTGSDGQPVYEPPKISGGSLTSGGQSFSGIDQLGQSGFDMGNLSAGITNLGTKLPSLIALAIEIGQHGGISNEAENYDRSSKLFSELPQLGMDFLKLIPGMSMFAPVFDLLGNAAKGALAAAFEANKGKAGPRASFLTGANADKNVMMDSENAVPMLPAEGTVNRSAYFLRPGSSSHGNVQIIPSSITVGELKNRYAANTGIPRGQLVGGTFTIGGARHPAGDDNLVVRITKGLPKIEYLPGLKGGSTLKVDISPDVAEEGTSLPTVTYEEKEVSKATSEVWLESFEVSDWQSSVADAWAKCFEGNGNEALAVQGTWNTGWTYYRRYFTTYMNNVVPRSIPLIENTFISFPDRLMCDDGQGQIRGTIKPQAHRWRAKAMLTGQPVRELGLLAAGRGLFEPVSSNQAFTYLRYTGDGLGGTNATPWMMQVEQSLKAECTGSLLSNAMKAVLMGTAFIDFPDPGFMMHFNAGYLDWGGVLDHNIQAGGYWKGSPSEVFAPPVIHARYITMGDHSVILNNGGNIGNYGIPAGYEMDMSGTGSVWIPVTNTIMADGGLAALWILTWLHYPYRDVRSLTGYRHFDELGNDYNLAGQQGWWNFAQNNVMEGAVNHVVLVNVSHTNTSALLAANAAVEGHIGIGVGVLNLDSTTNGMVTGVSVDIDIRAGLDTLFGAPGFVDWMNCVHKLMDLLGDITTDLEVDTAIMNCNIDECHTMLQPQTYQGSGVLNAPKVRLQDGVTQPQFACGLYLSQERCNQWFGYATNAVGQSVINSEYAMWIQDDYGRLTGYFAPPNFYVVGSLLRGWLSYSEGSASVRAAKLKGYCATSTMQYLRRKNLGVQIGSALNYVCAADGIPNKIVTQGSWGAVAGSPELAVCWAKLADQAGEQMCRVLTGRAYGSLYERVWEKTYMQKFANWEGVTVDWEYTTYSKTSVVNSLSRSLYESMDITYETKPKHHWTFAPYAGAVAGEMIVDGSNAISLVRCSACGGLDAATRSIPALVLRIVFAGAYRFFAVPRSNWNTRLHLLGIGAFLGLANVNDVGGYPTDDYVPYWGTTTSYEGHGEAHELILVNPGDASEHNRAPLAITWSVVGDSVPSIIPPQFVSEVYNVLRSRLIKQ